MPYKHLSTQSKSLLNCRRNRATQNIARHRIERCILGNDRHDVGNRTVVYDAVLDCKTEL